MDRYKDIKTLMERKRKRKREKERERERKRERERERGEERKRELRTYIYKPMKNPSKIGKLYKLQSTMH